MGGMIKKLICHPLLSALLVCLAIWALSEHVVLYGTHYHMAERMRQCSRSGGHHCTASYIPDCEQPKNNDEYDACQQKRMADSAWWQFRLSFVGLLGLAATVIYAARSTKAATDTAKASFDTLEIARKEFIASRRPWLTIDITPSSAYTNREITKPIAALSYRAASLELKCTIKNIGNYPARSISIKTGFKFCSGESVKSKRPIIDQFELATDTEASKPEQNIIFPTCQFFAPSLLNNHPLRQNQHSSLRHTRLFAYACVCYEFDTSKTKHYTIIVREVRRAKGVKPSSRGSGLLEEEYIAMENLAITPTFVPEDYAN